MLTFHTACNAPGLDRFSAEQDYAAIAFFFLRQPSRPRPVAKSGSAAGSGTVLTGALQLPAVLLKACDGTNPNSA